MICPRFPRIKEEYKLYGFKTDTTKVSGTTSGSLPEVSAGHYCMAVAYVEHFFIKHNLVFFF
jgi:hypothetical protein